MANPVHSSGPFDEYIYRLIVEASLDGWTPEVYFGKQARHFLLNRNVVDARRNLARYCGVNREWRDIAERLLYAAPAIGKPSVTAQWLFRYAQYLLEGWPPSISADISAGDRPGSYTTLAETLRNPHLSQHVLYLSIDCTEESAVDSLTRLNRMPKIRCLAVHQHTVPHTIWSATSRPVSSKHLSHLMFQGGDTHLLGQLLELLPHLQTLHVGRFSYSPIKKGAPPEHRITCRLREVVLQSVYHYDADLFGWLLKSSKDSIEHLSVAHYGSLLNDLIPYLGQAKRLDLTVKNNVFGVPEEPDHYQLSAIIPQFTRLEEVRTFCEISEVVVHLTPEPQLHLYAGQDWRSDWPDPKHASLQAEFPHLRISYKPYKHDFLECII